MNNKMIIDRKALKKESHKNLRGTYLKSVLIIFIFTLVMSGGYTFTSSLVNKTDNSPLINEVRNNFNSVDSLVSEIMKKNGKEDKMNEEKAKAARGVLAPIVNEVSKEKSAIVQFANTIRLFFYEHNFRAGLLSLFAAIIMFLIYVFIKLVLEIGKNRYYLEARKYRGTRLEKILYPYRTRKTLHLISIIFIRNVFLALWSLTIIGVFIKRYEYFMIPYILAENPNISRKDAFRLSKEMMYGLKWQTFKLDITLISWDILAVFTLGFSNLLYADAYKEFIYADLYINIRNNKKDLLTNGDLLCDNYLDTKRVVKGEYPIDKYITPLWYKKDFKTDYRQKYPVKTLILFFFTFSFIGWSWEVLLHLVSDGAFVNRGTMFGPWLPIYGTGALVILAVLKPFRTRPVVYFVVSMALAGILEYSTSWFLETFLGKKWWDYTGYLLNINGRICLEGLIVFGMGASAFTYFIGPLLNYYYKKIKPQISAVICTILIFAFSIDVVYSVKHPNTGKGITSYNSHKELIEIS